MSDICSVSCIATPNKVNKNTFHYRSRYYRSENTHAKVKVASVSDSLWRHGVYSPWNSPGQNTGVGSRSFSMGSSQPRNRSRSPTLQADSLPAKPPGNPKNTGVGSLFLLQRSSGPRKRTGVSCIAGGFFTSWATSEAIQILKMLFFNVFIMEKKIKL